MNGNLDLVIDYIYDNFRYGDEIPESKVNLLFQKYPLSEKKKQLAIKEISMLKITIVPEEIKVETLFDQLLFLIGKSKEFKESLLFEWYENNNIECDEQTRIRKKLNNLGYSIINDIPKEVNRSKFDFLNELNIEPLDILLASKTFNDKIDKLNSPIHSNYNIEYLSSLHSKSGEYTEKQKALDSLAQANINLVWKVVERYRGLSTQSFDTDDMFQHGMIGLIKAAKKFDLSKETQFSTYAVYWIRQSISRSIMNSSRTIRLPVHMRGRISKMKRVIGELEKHLTRYPLPEELGAEMDLLTPKVLETLVFFDSGVSLDSPVGSSQDSFLGDFIEDENNDSTDKKVIEDSLKREINNVLDKFTQREREIINMRFGLQNEKAKTLEEIGKLYGVTRERIRQIESKTLKKLRDDKVKERLRDYYEEF